MSGFKEGNDLHNNSQGPTNALDTSNGSGSSYTKVSLRWSNKIGASDSQSQATRKEQRTVEEPQIIPSSSVAEANSTQAILERSQRRIQDLNELMKGTSSNEGTVPNEEPSVFNFGSSGGSIS